MLPTIYRGKKSNVLSILTFNDASLWGADTFMAVIFALFITNNINEGTAIIVGFSFAIYRLARAFSSIPIGRLLDEHKGHIDEYFAVIGSGVLIGLSYFGLFFATEIWHVYLGMAFIGIGHSLDILSWKILFYGNMPKNSGGEIIGVYETFMQIVYALSTVIAGFIGEYYGFEWVLLVAAVLAFMSSGIMLTVGRAAKKQL